jgi:YVTN family beta-propeller protein
MASLVQARGPAGTTGLRVRLLAYVRLCVRAGLRVRAYVRLCVRAGLRVRAYLRLCVRAGPRVRAYLRIGLHARVFALALAAAVLAQLLVLGASLASFTGTKTATTGSLKSPKLATPTGLQAADGGCAGGSGQTNVSLEWNASALLDADGSPLINGYTVLRSTSSAGTYSAVGTVSGSPPPTGFTDVNPSEAATPQIFLGNGGAAKTVHAVDVATNEGTSIATGTIGIEPNAMAVTPEGTKLVVAEGASSQVQIVTVATDKVAKTVAIPKAGAANTSSRPDAVAVAPNGTTAYVLDGANELVYPLTISSGALSTGIAVGAQGDPGAILVTPNGEQVYVANYAAHTVSVISTTSKTVIATVAIGAGSSGAPSALAVTPDSTHVYVADQGNAQIDDIASSSDTVIHTIAVGSMADAGLLGGGDPNILAVTPEGSKLYVASYAAGTVTDIAIATDTITNTIALAGAGPNPNALALTPNGCQLYVHDHANNQVDAIAVSSDALLAHPAVGAAGDPTGMSVTPDSAHLYVANTAANSVSVIATATNTVAATLASGVLGASPYAVLASPSPYYYKLQAGHGGWQSATTAAIAYPLGWDQGDWQ